jgi:predicted ATPase with chaperone activity
MVEVGRVGAAEMADGGGERTDQVRQRVVAARAFRELRPEDNGMPLLLRKALDLGTLTARGAVKVRGVARTIADLAGSTQVADEHLAEAMSLRVQW